MRTIQKTTGMLRICTVKAAAIAMSAALALSLSACGGSGGSTSGGGAGFTSGKSTVSGNVQSVGGSVAASFSFDSNSTLAMILLSAVPEARADGHLAGIEVCIEGYCTTTDANGDFVIDISSLESGVYSLTFQVGNVVYTYPLVEEISADSEIVIADVEIQESGVVTVGSITHNQGGDEGSGDGSETDDTDDTGESNPGTVGGNISAAPENTANGNGPVKIVICHKPGTPAEKTLILPESAAVNGHLSHGDTMGACPQGGDAGDEDGGDDDTPE